MLQSRVSLPLQKTEYQSVGWAAESTPTVR
jgi:hypothetical protein